MEACERSLQAESSGANHLAFKKGKRRRYLVGSLHVGVEDAFGNGHQRWMGDPCAVVAIAHLPGLVSRHLCHQENIRETPSSFSCSGFRVQE
jgi:hypothetical protein